MLRDLAEAVYLSRIESFDRRVLTVVKPVGVPAAAPYEVGAPFDVLWTSAAGQHVLPTELTGTRSEGAVLLWDLIPVAPPWIEQRREFVRVPVFGRLRMTFGAEAEWAPAPEAASGYLVDVSEAALQATVWAEPGDSRLAVGARVVAEFTAHGEEFNRYAVVLGARPSGTAGELTVVLTFDQTPAQATALRRVVFSAQVDLRADWHRRGAAIPRSE